MAVEKDSKVYTEKQKALRATMDKIEKTYGKGSIIKMGDEEDVIIDVINQKEVVFKGALDVWGCTLGRDIGT